MKQLQREFTENSHLYIRKTRLGNSAIYSKEKINAGGYVIADSVEYLVVHIRTEKAKRIKINGYDIDFQAEEFIIEHSTCTFGSYQSALKKYRQQL